RAPAAFSRPAASHPNSFIRRASIVIVVMKPDATQAQIDGMAKEISALGMTPQVITGEHQTVVAALGQERPGLVETLETGDGVERVLPIMAPYKRASIEVKRERTVVKAL